MNALPCRRTQDTAEPPPACAMCKLHSTCVGAQLSKRENGIGQRRPVNPLPPSSRGKLLYHCGDPLSSLFVLRSGSARTLVSNSAGDESVLCFCLPGELLALSSLGQTTYADCTVLLERSALCEINAAALETECARDARLLRTLLHGISTSVALERRARQRLSFFSADARVADFLIEYSTRLRAIGRDAQRFQLTMSRDDLARHLSLASETVSRSLGRLCARNVVATEARWVTLLNTEALAQIGMGDEQCAGNTSTLRQASCAPLPCGILQM